MEGAPFILYNIYCCQNQMTPRHLIQAISLLLSPSLAIASPQTATNIAPSGTVIMGLDHPEAVANPHLSKSTPYINSGPEKEHLASWLNDEKVDSRFADTWAGAHTVLPKDKGVDYIGIKNLASGSQIVSLTLHGLTFNDGGWFGTNGSLDTRKAISPQLQYSTDNGQTWKNHPSESDYVEQVAKAGLSAPHYTSTFTFAPIQGANAIRLIGTTGGRTTRDKNGFVGARELIVHTGRNGPSKVTASSLISIDSVSLILK